jgi:hypothetical protein
VTHHFVTKCEGCQKVIVQCRCPDPNKTVRWGMCDACTAAEAERAAIRPWWYGTTEPELLLVELYRSLDDDGRAAVRDFDADLANRVETVIGRIAARRGPSDG